ncbi:MAG: N-methyl-L-tryptophan oxidase [Verrucomicrobiaceae bacterium]|nr:MAG: N-methyl-L-tryptophan oxidase [Verrucomicrobiaceae bacterium]
MKVAVIGVGGSGSAALRFLAKEGHEAVGYEQFTVGHAMGSSHGRSRIIRLSYPDDFHTGLMRRAYELWDDLEIESGENLFVKCGGITFGPGGDTTLRNTISSLANASIPHELLDRDQCATRFPAIDIGPGSTAVYQQDSGFLRSTRCVLAQLGIARQHGAEVREHSPVFAIEEKNGKVLVSTASKTEVFDTAIVTAGPWIGKLLAPLHLPVTTALRQVAYFAIRRNPENFAPGKLPVWITHSSDHYGFPADGEVTGIKIASHDAGMTYDPDQPDRPVMPEHLEALAEKATALFPDLSGDIVSSQSCLYTTTPDEHFILDHAPGSPRILLCSGCSGHGFKFTILLGRLLADMATRTKADASPTPWRLARFPVPRS